VFNSGARPVVRGTRVHDNRASGLRLNADVYSGGDGLITGALIENNVIYRNGAAGGGAINLDGVQDSIVRNNLLYENLGTGIVNYEGFGAAGPKGMQVLNNTVVQAAAGRYAMLVWRSAGPNRVRNNILYHPSTSRGSINYLDATDIANTDSDYNVITKVTPNDGGTLYTLAEWRAQGREIHSVTATPATLFANLAAADYRLRTGSPAIDRGQALTTVPKDMEGTARPAGAGWDLGAYEGGSGSATTGSQPVVWTAVVGATASGNSLTKTAATGWGNAGAVSTRQIASGDGFVEVTATNTVTHRSMFGFSRGNSDAGYVDIDFGLFQRYGQLQVYEKGVPMFTGGAYAVGDKLRVAVVGGVVRYSRNGVVFYTSRRQPTYPLLLDAAIYTLGSTLGSATISAQ
jgi:hypothetical protein